MLIVNREFSSLNRGLSSNFCRLRSENHVKFTEECVMCMEKSEFVTMSLTWKDSSWSGNTLTLQKRKCSWCSGLWSCVSHGTWLWPWFYDYHMHFWVVCCVWKIHRRKMMQSIRNFFWWLGWSIRKNCLSVSNSKTRKILC